MEKERQENPPFGLEKKEGIWDEFIGKYVVIYIPNGRNFAGKLTEIKDDFYGILSPFQTGKYSEKDFKKELSGERAMVYLSGASIELTTKKNLENYCIFENSEFKKKDKKRLKDKPAKKHG